MVFRDIKSLPDRPLRADELEGLREADSVVEAAPLGLVDGEGARGGSADAAGVIRALAVQAAETLYGLGYDEANGWTVVDEREAGDPEDLAAVRDALKDWDGTNG